MADGIGGCCVFSLVGFSVAIGVAVDSGKGVLLGSAVSVGATVKVTGVTLGPSHAVGVPVGVLVSSGAAVSVRVSVGLGVGLISTPSSSLNTWNRSKRISRKTMITNMARLINSLIIPQERVCINPSPSRKSWS